jgi:hypothetical protein
VQRNDRSSDGACANAAEGPDRVADLPCYRFRDVVDSKGSGVLFLLYGPPGTGKTLAVEALAARFARPLYSLSFAELGSSVAELEERLQVSWSQISHMKRALAGELVTCKLAMQPCLHALPSSRPRLHSSQDRFQE